MRPPYGILLATKATPAREESLRRAYDTGISLLLVDDGTSESAARLASRVGIFAIRHPIPFGRVQALLSGVHYAIGDESPGAILVAAADDPALDRILPALAQEVLRYDARAIVVGVSPGLLPDPLMAAAGLWRWWQRDRGPAYAVPIEIVRSLSLGPLNRGPELGLLLRAARGEFSLRTLPG